jgi:hypothetical protein
MDTWLEKYVKGTTELPAKAKVDFKNWEG